MRSTGKHRMTNCAKPFKLATLTLALITTTSAALAQNYSGQKVQAMILNTANTGSTDALNSSEFTAVLYGTAVIPLPTGLPGGNYRAWCGTTVTQSAGSDVTYTIASNPADAANVTPLPLASPTTWNQVNWILNNKAGYTVEAVQGVIWGLMGGLCGS